jgi:hypothetical protein
LGKIPEGAIMTKEFLATFLWCYRDDKKRFLEEMGGCLLAIAGGILLVVVLTGIWG